MINPDFCANSRTATWFGHKQHIDLVKVVQGTPSYKGFGTQRNDQLDPGTDWTHQDYNNRIFRLMVETRFDFYVPEVDVDKYIVAVGIWKNMAVVSRETGEIAHLIKKKYRKNSLDKISKFDTESFDDDKVMYSIQDLAYWDERGIYFDPKEQKNNQEDELKTRIEMRKKKLSIIGS